jgi:hypothetical protein
LKRELDLIKQNHLEQERSLRIKIGKIDRTISQLVNSYKVHGIVKHISSKAVGCSNSRFNSNSKSNQKNQKNGSTEEIEEFETLGSDGGSPN